MCYMHLDPVVYRALQPQSIHCWVLLIPPPRAPGGLVGCILHKEPK